MMHIFKIIEKKYWYFIDKKHFDSKHKLIGINGPFRKNDIPDLTRINTLTH